MKTLIEDKDQEINRMKKYIEDIKTDFRKRQMQDLNEIKKLNEIIHK